MCDSVQNHVLGFSQADEIDEFRSLAVLRPSSCSLRVAILFLTLVSCAVVCAENTRPSKLLTGRRFSQSLETRRGIHVQNVPLRKVLTMLQQQAELCIVVDRRIDPSFRLTLNTGLVPTLDLLRQVAAELPHSDVSVNRTFVFVGPTAGSRQLRTLCEWNRSMILKSRSRFDPDTYAKISTGQTFDWTELESPRDLLTRLAVQSGLVVVNPEAVPHDVWHAGRFPVMPNLETWLPEF